MECPSSYCSAWCTGAVPTHCKIMGLCDRRGTRLYVYVRKLQAPKRASHASNWPVSAIPQRKPT